MTKKEVIVYFHHRKVFCEDRLKICPKDSIASKEKEICDMAIKALEQESILDKIRDEIETQEKWLAQSGYNAYNVDIAFKSIKLVLAEMENGK